jgi:hypothetical protein
MGRLEADHGRAPEHALHQEREKERPLRKTGAAGSYWLAMYRIRER